MPRAQIAALAPRAAQADVERRAADPVGRSAVGPARDEDEHRDEGHALVHDRLVQ